MVSFVIVSVILAALQAASPRRFAFVPLLIAACLVPHSMFLNLGVSFSVARIVILVGLIRAASTGAFTFSLRHPLDRLAGLWALIALVSTIGHDPTDSNPLTIRLALVYDVLGAYLYFRAFVRTRGDLARMCKCVAALMVVLAVPMLFEKATGRNPYASVFGGSVHSDVREGRVRGKGPFGGAILLGTAGATCLPLIFAARRRFTQPTWIGAAACGAIVLASGSSGPIGSLIVALLGLALWRWRNHIKTIRTGAILCLFMLHLIMKAPVWYLLARIDLVGGSTGWHRAELITQALARLNEWWLIGTDSTRHWMPTGIAWSSEQTDITNYYIQMGVIGGLPLMLAFIAFIIKSCQLFGRAIRSARRAHDPHEWLFWCLGAALFAHSVTFLTITYYDQSNVLLTLVFAAAARATAIKFKPVTGPSRTPTPAEYPEAAVKSIGATEHAPVAEYMGGK